MSSKDWIMIGGNYFLNQFSVLPVRLVYPSGVYACFYLRVGKNLLFLGKQIFLPSFSAFLQKPKVAYAKITNYQNGGTSIYTTAFAK
jgi:hypothetical protein